MKTYLDPEDVELMEAAATCHRDKLLVRLLFRLGCRVSEALIVKIDDIDFDRGTVTIRHLKTRIRLSCPECGTHLARSHTFCPRCGSDVKEAVARELEHRRLRILPLDADTLNLIGNYIARRRSPSQNGKIRIFNVNRHQAWRIVRDCAERTGIPNLVNPETGRTRGVSPHRLRDAFAVHAVKLDDSGDGLRLLQEHLGHASFNTTAKYRKVAGEEHKAWYQKLWV